MGVWTLARCVLFAINSYDPFTKIAAVCIRTTCSSCFTILGSTQRQRGAESVLTISPATPTRRKHSVSIYDSISLGLIALRMHLLPNQGLEAAGKGLGCFERVALPV
jgi:hypothetical protein